MISHESRIAELYRRHFSELVSFLARRVASRELAADLVQELFLRLLSRHGAMAAVDHDRGYLFSSVRHLAVEARRSGRWREASDEAIDAGGFEAVLSPEYQMEDKQTVERLIKVVSRLPPRCRQVFLLHKIENLSYGEVASTLGISVSSVEKHMMRALEACRMELDRGGGR